MKNTYSLIALMLLIAFSMQITPSFADGGQLKEEDVLVERSTQTEARQLPNVLTAPAKIFKPKEGKSEKLFNRLPGMDLMQKAKSAKESRRYMETPVLVMIIGGGVWLLGIILAVVGAASLTSTGFGLVGIGWLLTVLGGLTATAGFIWWIVTR